MDLYTKFNHTCRYVNKKENVYIPCMNCLLMLNTFSSPDSKCSSSSGSSSCSSSCSCKFEQTQKSICEKCVDIDWILKDYQIKRNDYFQELCKTDDHYLIELINEVNIEITILKKILLERKFELYNNNKIEESSAQSAEDKHV